MELKDYDHDYYCSDSNYYNNDANGEFNSWNEFLEEFNDADIDMNLIFRWDLREYEETSSYYLEVFMIHQRKGIFSSHIINNIKEEDLKSIENLLNKHWKKLVSIWNPISLFKLV